VSAAHLKKIKMTGKNPEEKRKYIALVRNHACCSYNSENRDPKDWQIIESSGFPVLTEPMDLGTGFRYQAGCDSLSDLSQCSNCGIWIQRLEPYSHKRAVELGLEKQILPSEKLDITYEDGKPIVHPHCDLSPR
jgi:hypothetical protein